MKYNIKLHILDHATYIIDELTNDSNNIHFNTSVCTTYFLRQGICTQKGIDEIMINILKNISSKKIIVKEKNGTYTKKNGKIVQRYRIRTITFNNILSAYHSRHFNSSKSVNPHFHFLFPKNTRMGKDFIYLKQVLKEEAIIHKIKFNFMEKGKITGLSSKQLSRVESLSWLLNQGIVSKIKQYVSNTKKLTETLDLLQIYYTNTQNISYFIKVLTILNQRLHEHDINFMYKNMNLKENIYFFLNDTQKNMLTSLENARTVEIKLTDVLDRELLKKSHGFQSDVLNIISRKFNLSNLSPKQLIYSKKDDGDTDVLKVNSFRKLIVKDLRNSLAYAKNEKDWKDILLKMGYIKVSINSSKTSSKRTKTAITVTTNKQTKVQILFYAMNLNFKKITHIMMHNKKRNRKKENYDNHYDEYKKRKKRQHEILEKYIVQMELLLKIYSNSKIQTKITTAELKHLARKYTINTSEMYKITTYQSTDTTIVDNDTNITLKKSEANKEKAVKDMLDIAILKGWSLTSLTIRGSPDFVYEVKKEIQRRLEPKNIEAKKPEINKSTHLKI